MTPEQYRSAVVLLCERGLLTCTSGRPGNPNATYAIAWAPLDRPEDYSEDVRRRHAENMRRLLRECSA